MNCHWTVIIPVKPVFMCTKFNAIVCHMQSQRGHSTKLLTDHLDFILEAGPAVKGKAGKESHKKMISDMCLACRLNMKT